MSPQLHLIIQVICVIFFCLRCAKSSWRSVITFRLPCCLNLNILLNLMIKVQGVYAKAYDNGKYDNLLPCNCSSPIIEYVNFVRTVSVLLITKWTFFLRVQRAMRTAFSVISLPRKLHLRNWGELYIIFIVNTFLKVNFFFCLSDIFFCQFSVRLFYGMLENEFVFGINKRARPTCARIQTHR